MASREPYPYSGTQAYQYPSGAATYPLDASQTPEGGLGRILVPGYTRFRRGETKSLPRFLGLPADEAGTPQAC